MLTSVKDGLAVRERRVEVQNRRERGAVGVDYCGGSIRDST